MQWIHARIPQIKTLGYFLWMGMALASLFFYPLIASLHDQLWYLQWKRANSWELFFSLVLVSLFTAFALWSTFRCRVPHVKLLILLLIVSIPLLSFSIHVIRQLGYTFYVIQIGMWFRAHRIIVLFFSGATLLVPLSFFFRFPRRVFQLLMAIILFLSPLSLVSVVTIVQAGLHDTTTTIRPPAEDNRPPSDTMGTSPRTIVFLLFDELSYQYLYQNGNIRPEFPHLAELSAISTNYHKAIAPSNGTFTSVPLFLFDTQKSEIVIKNNRLVEIRAGIDSPLRDDADNLFHHAREKGFTTAVFGPYFRYCMLFSKYVDYCHSYSSYNYAGVNPSFSLFNPIATTIILWPHQLPFGWLKRPMYAEWQRRGTELIEQSTMEALATKRSLFLFTHFLIPHIPFAFDKDGFHPAKDPFLQNDENYIRQLGYVDTLVGRIVDELKRLKKFDTTTLAIFSDHNYRMMVTDEHKTEIPLMIKKAGQQKRRDIDESVKAQEVLRTVVLEEDGLLR